MFLETEKKRINNPSIKQILDSNTAKELFQEFYEGEYHSEKVNWSDMTSMFLDE